MSRLVIISNRLPLTIDRKDGALCYHPSAGGLATGLDSLDTSIEKLWIGWVGMPVESEVEKDTITQDLRRMV